MCVDEAEQTGDVDREELRLRQDQGRGCAHVNEHLGADENEQIVIPSLDQMVSVRRIRRSGLSPMAQILDVPRGQRREHDQCRRWNQSDEEHGLEREHGHTRPHWPALPVGARHPDGHVTYGQRPKGVDEECHPLGALARAERSERGATARDHQAIDTGEDQQILVHLSEGTRKEVAHLAGNKRAHCSIVRGTGEETEESSAGQLENVAEAGIDQIDGTRVVFLLIEQNENEHIAEIGQEKQNGISREVHLSWNSGQRWWRHPCAFAGIVCKSSKVCVEYDIGRFGLSVWMTSGGVQSDYNAFFPRPDWTKREETRMCRESGVAAGWYQKEEFWEGIFREKRRTFEKRRKKRFTSDYCTGANQLYTMSMRNDRTRLKREK